MLFIVQCILHSRVKPPRRQVRRNAATERPRSRVFIEPQPQLFQLFPRQRPDYPLDFFNYFSAHIHRPLAIPVRKANIVCLSSPPLRPPIPVRDFRELRASARATVFASLFFANADSPHPRPLHPQPIS